MAKNRAFFQVWEKSVGRRGQPLASWTTDPPDIFVVVIYIHCRAKAGWPWFDSLSRSKVYRHVLTILNVKVQVPPRAAAWTNKIKNSFSSTFSHSGGTSVSSADFFLNILKRKLCNIAFPLSSVWGRIVCKKKMGDTRMFTEASRYLVPNLIRFDRNRILWDLFGGRNVPPWFYRW